MKRLMAKIKLLHKSKKAIIIVIITTAIIVVSSLVFFSRKVETIEIVATVNGQLITRQELQQTIDYRQRFFDTNEQTLDRQAVEQDSLTIVIDETLLRQYAATNSLTASEEELDQLYSARIQQFVSEEKLLAEVYRLYGFSKEAYRSFLYSDILRERVQANTGKPYSQWIEEQKRNADITRSF
jgi:parvulin-like peptidyl-prolyl isomerase